MALILIQTNAKYAYLPVRQPASSQIQKPVAIVMHHFFLSHHHTTADFHRHQQQRPPIISHRHPQLRWVPCAYPPSPSLAEYHQPYRTQLPHHWWWRAPTTTTAAHIQSKYLADTSAHLLKTTNHTRWGCHITGSDKHPENGVCRTKCPWQGVGDAQHI